MMGKVSCEDELTFTRLVKGSFSLRGSRERTGSSGGIPEDGSARQMTGQQAKGELGDEPSEVASERRDNEKGERGPAGARLGGAQALHLKAADA